MSTPCIQPSKLAPPPVVASPKIIAQWFAGICELGPRPLVMTGFLRLWMTKHFEDQTNIEDQDSQALRRALWMSNCTSTGISIESVTKWTPELTEKRPAIIIKRGAWRHIRLGIDNRHFFTMPADAQNSYTNLWQGSHTLFCIAGEGAEAEILAAEVFRELNEQASTIRKILDLMRFEVMEVGEIAKLEQKGRENFVVPVTVGYAYREDWKIEQSGPLFKKLDLAALQP